MPMKVRYTTFNGVLVEEDRDGTVLDYVTDSLGSVIMWVNDSGSPEDYVMYWPYGEPTAEPAVESPFRYVGALGYYTDAGGLYVRAREYQPENGRWMTVDPLWPFELPYSYCNIRPTTVIDPTGLQPRIPKCVCNGKGGKPALEPSSGWGSHAACLLRVCASWCTLMRNPTEEAAKKCSLIGQCKRWNDVYPPCTSGENWKMCGEQFTPPEQGVGANQSNWPAPRSQTCGTSLGGEWCCIECEMRVCCHFANLNNLYLKYLKRDMLNCLKN
jgi:RHS repeat-associated protein